MNVKSVEQAQAMYRNGKNHKEVKRAFGLNNAQEYAINIFGRDKGLSAEYLSERVDSLTGQMTIGQVAVALGFPAEAAIETGPGGLIPDRLL